MSETIRRTVDAMAVNALATVERHKDRRPYRLSRAVAWERRRDAYDRAAGITCPPMADRAQALAVASNRRALAWRALAAMDAREAASHRKQGHVARLLAPGIQAGVWRV
jgi:hypothetical protein